MSKKKDKNLQLPLEEAREDINAVNVANYAQQAYLDYAMSVVCGRAIPYLEDGQKPVQRRILYAMQEMRLNPDTKPVKSAKIIGSVLGSYHPHGDQSVYDAMVRQTQNFVMRYPLVHGEGNFGSRDGDTAAAMRYTEAKLSQNSKYLLRDLNQGSVDFRANYDGTTEEPEILPARLPFILMNGAEGVGVGMACSIPPHRATELVNAVIAILKNKEATFEDIMSHIQGPDFPTGGQLIQSREKILAVYQDGNGTLKLRGKWDIDHGARGSWRLIVKELPYGVSPQRMMEQVDALLNPKGKDKGNKKEFTQDQTRLKNLFGNLIDNYRDESGKEQAVRVVFEPKTSKQDPEDLIAALLAHTGLQETIKFNFVVVGRDRRPAQMGILKMLQEWSEFRVDITRRRLIHEQAQAEKRLHIVEGRIKVLDAIQEAIRVIQEADEPKKALMERFDLTEIQANDVLDMRLRALARLEANALVKEKAELEKTIARIKRLLAKAHELIALVITELEEDLKNLGDDERKTTVEEVADADEAPSKAKAIARAPAEEITVGFSDKFWVRAKNGADADAESFIFKTGDPLVKIQNCTTHDTLFALDHNGRVYCMDATDIPSGRGGEGMPLASAWDLQGKLTRVWMGKEEDKYLMISSGGHGFIATGLDLQTRLKAGKAAMTILEGDNPHQPILIQGDITEQSKVVCLSSDGSIVSFALKELPVMAKGKGVAFMGLRENCKLVQAIIINDDKFGIKEGTKTKWIQGEEFGHIFGPRSAGKKGKKLSKTADVSLVIEEKKV